MKFNAQKNYWTVMKKMITARSFFASGVINGKIYVAAVLDGKLLVTKGWFWPFYVVPRGQIYDPKTDHWENMPDGLREGWTGSSAVIYGHLFVVTEHERTKLKVYDPNNDSWRLTKKIGFYGFFGSLCFF
ncbi:putative kelch-type beta propeller [Helianthus annuus]|nr:putative kelch-type beta propeller [Helianthus annuus]